MENYLMDCSLKTFKKIHSKCSITRNTFLDNLDRERFLKKMQERVKVLS